MHMQPMAQAFNLARTRSQCAPVRPHSRVQLSVFVDAGCGRARTYRR